MAIGKDNTRPKITLSQELYKEARKEAAYQGRSFSSYVERLIAQDVEDQANAKKKSHK